MISNKELATPFFGSLIVIIMVLLSNFLLKNLDKFFITPKTKGGFKSDEAKKLITKITKKNKYKIKNVAPDLISIER